MLEIGCGTGTLALKIAQQDAVQRLVGCDVSGGMLKRYLWKLEKVPEEQRKKHELVLTGKALLLVASLGQPR